MAVPFYMDLYGKPVGQRLKRSEETILSKIKQPVNIGKSSIYRLFGVAETVGFEPTVP